MGAGRGDKRDGETREKGWVRRREEEEGMGKEDEEDE